MSISLQRCLLLLITFSLIIGEDFQAPAQQAARVTVPLNVSAPDGIELPNVKISLEIKRLPLDALLKELGKQSGVEFNAVADYPAAQTLITARVREMPLTAFLASLSRIYGVQWVKVGEKAYAMQSSDRPPLEVKMLRARWSDFTNLSEAEEKRQTNADLASEIFDAVDDQAWRAKEGVPVAQLTPELQARVQRLVQESKALWIIDEYATVSKVFNQNLYLRFAPIPRDAVPFLPAMGPIIKAISKSPRNGALLAVYTADGQLVMPVLPEFYMRIRNDNRGVTTTKNPN